MLDNKLAFSSMATDINSDQAIADEHAMNAVACDDASYWGADPMLIAISNENDAEAEWECGHSTLSRAEFIRQHISL